jgi:hypothetical protein
MSKNTLITLRVGFLADEESNDDLCTLAKGLARQFARLDHKMEVGQ